MQITSSFFIVVLFKCVYAEDAVPSAPEGDLFTVEGKLVYVKSPETSAIDGARTKISADGNQYVGFLRADRESFTISGLPSGSYLIEVYHPEFLFESVRVDISSKGKIRARRPESLETLAVSNQGGQPSPVAYPLRLRMLRKANYFTAKEAWRLTDMLMNPMVLMMVLPLVVLMVIPKLLQSVDPEAHRELQSTMGSVQQPNFSEMMSSLMSGGAAQQKPAGPKKTAITAKDRR